MGEHEDPPVESLALSSFDLEGMWTDGHVCMPLILVMRRWAVVVAPCLLASVVRHGTHNATVPCLALTSAGGLLW